MISTPSALKDVLQSAGRSLADAQGELFGQPSDLVIGEAELELKTTVSATADGLTIEPVSSAAALRSGLAPGLISTVRVRYVAVAPQNGAATTTSATPTDAERDAIVAKVNELPDLLKARELFGSLNIAPFRVDAAKRWLVLVLDPRGRAIREFVLPMES